VLQDRALDEDEGERRDSDRHRDPDREEDRVVIDAGALRGQPEKDRPVVQVDAVADAAEGT
jgi:hypothetical protein